MKTFSRILDAIWKVMVWVGDYSSPQRKFLGPPWHMTVTNERGVKSTVAVNVPNLNSVEIIADSIQLKHGVAPLLFQVYDSRGVVVASCWSYNGRPFRC